MYEKERVFQQLYATLKEIIIPNLSRGVDEEQAVAMISILKNLEQNLSDESHHRWDEVNFLRLELPKRLDELMQQPFIEMPLKGWVTEQRQMIDSDNLQFRDVDEVLSFMNDIECQLIRHLYGLIKSGNQELGHKLLQRTRSMLRQQLAFQIAVVR